VESKPMAELLNSHFIAMFSREDLTSVPTPTAENAHEMPPITITRKEIKDVIKGMRAEAAPGPDGITPRIIKDLGDSILTPLELIFKKSLAESKVPKDWKTATVIPIFKKGQKKDPGNYRPVSLTSIPCKILETVIKNHLMKHLVERNLIRDTQHGFMPGRSCTTNLVLTMDRVTEKIDAGIPADMVYLDFSKAFDKVPHKRLMKKLEAKGTDKKVLAWVEDWLCNRTQRVRVGAEFSEPGTVEFGVPQGTILGPCLFNVFIDDIDEIIEEIEQTIPHLVTIIKFADDAKVLANMEGEEDRARLQQVLDQLCVWARRWGMAFNLKKCKVMHFGHNNPRNAYTMMGERLDTTEEERDLGIQVHNSLKPTNQCRRAAGRASAVLGQITRNFHYRDRKTFLSLYKQYVRPHLEFASPAWSPWSEGDKAILERVQEKALKNTTGLMGRTYEERCKEVSLETLERRRQIQDMSQTFKILKGVDRVEPDQLFSRVRGEVRTRLSADPWNLQKKRARKEVRLHSFGLRVVDPWNSLPSVCKEKDQIWNFKKFLKKDYY
jgi:hypothetical protein